MKCCLVNLMIMVLVLFSFFFFEVFGKCELLSIVDWCFLLQFWEMLIDIFLLNFLESYILDVFLFLIIFTSDLGFY